LILPQSLHGLVLSVTKHLDPCRFPPFYGIMPKVVRGRTKYHEAAPPLDPEPLVVEEEEDDGPEVDASGMTRGQRKRMKKREEYLRKFEFVNFVRRQEEVKTSGSLDMASLGENLDDTPLEEADETQHGAKRPSRKVEAQRKEQEISQFQGVLGLAAYQQDPFAALSQHLKNSMKKQQQQDEQKVERQRLAQEQEKARQAARQGIQVEPTGVPNPGSKKRNRRR